MKGNPLVSWTLLMILTGLMPAVEEPNIVFIFFDDQGWNGTSVSVHSHRADSKRDDDEMPNFERLVVAGMCFE